MFRFVYRAAVVAALCAIGYGGLVLLRFLTVHVPRPALSPAETTVFVSILIVTAHVIVAVHELGHVAAGRLAGLRLHLLIIGPLRIVRDDGHLRLGLNRDLAHYAGLAGSTAVSGSATGRQLLAVAAGGPVASILLGMLGVILFGEGIIETIGDGAFARFVLGRTLAVFAAGSLTVGLANLVPMRLGENRSDGARILSILRERGDV